MSRFTTLIAACCLALSGTAAVAQRASSSAYGVSANEQVSAAGVVSANASVGPISQASGAAPPSYDDSNTVASVSQNAALTTGITGVTQSLQTGILTSSASGTATGAQATATVNNLQLTESQAGLLTSLLGLGATTIQSHSEASSLGGLSASGPRPSKASRSTDSSPAGSRSMRACTSIRLPTRCCSASPACRSSSTSSPCSATASTASASARMRST